jgi:hypothetical protein
MYVERGRGDRFSLAGGLLPNPQTPGRRGLASPKRECAQAGAIWGGVAAGGLAIVEKYSIQKGNVLVSLKRSI